MARGRIPLVRSPRQASGGGAASAFGLSGAPLVPVPQSRRGKIIQIQYADDERGRFTERIFSFPAFNALAPGGTAVSAATDESSVQIVSNRTSFVRLVALRGVLKLSDTLPLTGFEEANLLLQVDINGEENLVTAGERTGTSSFAELFDNNNAPWFWFAAPPRLRVGEILNATITNDFAANTEINLTPALSARIVDDRWWQAMYGEIRGEAPEGDEDED